jgi:hypothetical protein
VGTAGDRQKASASRATHTLEELRATFIPGTAYIRCLATYG